ncbi:MAG: hypothetical protein IJU71_08290 [Selenomonadaceae bacterium]|nr:hypothetical protein [Selenomonadaceae bacterium]
MHDIPRVLLDFIAPDDQFQSILVVDSVDYLPELRQRFPNSNLHAVTADDDAPAQFNDLNIDFRLLDYRQERLPFDEESFDAIIGDLTLELVDNPQDIAAGFAAYIKQTGVWLTSFRNVRHWSIIERLMHGHFGAIASRLYAKAEFERLCYASFYKEVRMMPVERRAKTDLVDRLISVGFENINDDLQTEFWLVRAARSVAELALLKSMYTVEIRAELSKLIRRIEYGIELERSINEFWSLYDRAGLFIDYAAQFIRMTTVHRERFFRSLISMSDRAEARELEQAANDFEFDD